LNYIIFLGLFVPGGERNTYLKSSLSIHCLKQGNPRQHSSGLDWRGLPGNRHHTSHTRGTLRQ